MRRSPRKTFAVLASAVISIALAPPLWAQDQKVMEDPAINPMTPEYFRDVLLEFADLAGGLGVPARALTESISGMTAEEMQTFYNAFPDAQIFTDSVQILGSQFEVLAAVSKARSEFETELRQREAMGVVGILPGIDPFPPNYPSAGLLGFLEGLIDAVPGIDVDFTDEKQRCQDDFKLALIIAQTVAKALGTIAQAVCDTIVVVCPAPGGTNLPACILAGTANAVVDVAQFGLDACAAQQAGVDSAEIEAAFENSLLIFEGLKCVEASQDRMNHGCNGEDDDCDGTIDECDEDVFGPVVFIDPAVRVGCYDSAAEAAEAIALAVFAFDDCGNVTIGPPDVQGTECDVTVAVTATDDCGNSTTVSTVITIDGDGADIDIDPSVNAPGVCYSSIDEAEQAVLDAATITDNCSSGDDLTITVHSSVEECALRVRLKVVDKCGNESTSAVTVRVDPHVPSVDIQVLRLGFRGEVLGFQTPVCYETVAQAEQAVLAVTHAEDNCTADKELITSVSSAGDPCSLLVTSKAVDECGNENTDSETVRVDAEDPVVTCAVATDRLSPPNHTMRNVGFTFTATDNCTGEPEIEIFITSDETTASADGAGQTSPAPDGFILRDLDGVFQGILLRAERSSKGNGRVYEITVRATDECGNVGECSANVTVSPANGQPATDDGQFYDATEVN